MYFFSLQARPLLPVLPGVIWRKEPATPSDLDANVLFSQTTFSDYNYTLVFLGLVAFVFLIWMVLV
jgi:hypothetical protein